LGLIIALDAMGGDHGPHVTVPAALSVLAEQQGLSLILVGDKQTLEQELQQHPQKIATVCRSCMPPSE